MHRLLIVDDEIEVVEYFHRIFTEKCDIPLEVYTAYSANEALKCLSRTRIDIVLSDIKMPKMTGLQMYEIIKSKWPKCKVIFLSGVLEFDYVYESIQKREVRYLTKLEPTEKIIATVKEVIDEIEQSYKQRTTMEKVQQQIKTAFPLLQNQYLQNLLYGIRESDKAIQKRFDELEIKLNVEKPMIMVGGIFDNLPQDIGPYELDKYIYSLKTIALDYFNSYYNSACYISEQKYFIWLLQSKEGINTSNIQNSDVVLNGILEYIQGASRKNLDLTLTFVYESTPIICKNISKHYSNIKSRLGYRSRLMNESIIALSEHEKESSLLWQDKKVIDSCKQLVRVNELEGYLELGQKESFFSLLCEIIEPLAAVQSFNYNPALEIYYSVVCMFLKYINEWNMTETLAFKLDLHKLTRADEHASWKEAVEYLKNLAELIFEIHFKNENIWSVNAIAVVQKYILENLNKDLSLITLAEMVKLNPSYLSRLFKSVTNVNLYDYILEMRISKAKELLVKTGDKIQDIAAVVGYESAHSFTRTFKKYTGKTPSEYREQ